jgi:hypothetical protein
MGRFLLFSSYLMHLPAHLSSKDSLDGAASGGDIFAPHRFPQRFATDKWEWVVG